MKQIITRVDEELAAALKRQAHRAGESVNSYVTRLLRIASAGGGTSRQMWKAAAVAEGRLMSRPAPPGRPRAGAVGHAIGITTPAGYAVTTVSSERDER